MSSENQQNVMRCCSYKMIQSLLFFHASPFSTKLSHFKCFVTNLFWIINIFKFKSTSATVSHFIFAGVTVYGEQTSPAKADAKAEVCRQLTVRRWTVLGRLGLTPPPTSEAHWLLRWIAGRWLQSFKSSVLFNPPSLPYKAKDLFLGCYYYSCLKRHSARWHKDFYSLLWWVHRRMCAVFDLPVSLQNTFNTT